MESRYHSRVSIKQSLFLECPRPITVPDKVTRDIKGGVSSEYWFPKNSNIALIRNSNHWIRARTHNIENKLVLGEGGLEEGRRYTGICNKDSQYLFECEGHDIGRAEYLYISKEVCILNPRYIDTVKEVLTPLSYNISDKYVLKYILWLVYFGGSKITNIKNSATLIGQNPSYKPKRKRTRSRSRHTYGICIECGFLYVFETSDPKTTYKVISTEKPEYVFWRREIIGALQITKARLEKRSLSQFGLDDSDEEE